MSQDVKKLKTLLKNDPYQMMHIMRIAKVSSSQAIRNWIDRNSIPKRKRDSIMAYVGKFK